VGGETWNHPDDIEKRWAGLHVGTVLSIISACALGRRLTRSDDRIFLMTRTCSLAYKRCLVSYIETTSRGMMS
jgi:hypothetical protein